jgi:L-threonylcarbamoyladenylate synthase
VTGPWVVGKRRPEALAALADGQVIAVPGDGGYHLAARHDHPDALAQLRALAPDGTEDVPLHMVVGRRAQAVALASVWTEEAGLLTDRMWPGPLTVIVPLRHEAGDRSGGGNPVVHITMPAARAVRALCRDGEPLVVRALRRPDGVPIIDPDEVAARFTSPRIALIVNGGVCPGAGPTVVDCTASPPAVYRVGALPGSYVDAALMMGNRRRKWFRRRSGPDAPAR